MNHREIVLKMNVIAPPSENRRIAELELENLRLHRLVAELLLKNQKLRATLAKDTALSPVSSLEDAGIYPDTGTL